MKATSTLVLIFGAYFSLHSQNTYLDFKHKRVVRQNYEIFSSQDVILFFNEGGIDAEIMDCTCMKPKEGELLIQFSRNVTTNEGSNYESILITRIDLAIVKEVVQFRVPGINATIDRHSVSKFNLSISSFNFDQLEHISGVAFYSLEKPFGLTGSDYQVSFRFRCKEGEISISNL